MKNTWRLILKILGAAMAVSGLICLVVSYWDEIWATVSAAKDALAVHRSERRRVESDDYDDEALYD